MKTSRLVRRSSEVFRSSYKWQIRLDVEGGRDNTVVFPNKLRFCVIREDLFLSLLSRRSGQEQEAKKDRVRGGSGRKRCQEVQAEQLRFFLLTFEQNKNSAHWLSSHLDSFNDCTCVYVWMYERRSAFCLINLNKVVAAKGGRVTANQYTNVVYIIDEEIMALKWRFKNFSRK